MKAVSSDKKAQNEPELEPDQVALESQDQESPPAILLSHSPPRECTDFSKETKSDNEALSIL